MEIKMFRLMNIFMMINQKMQTFKLLNRTVKIILITQLISKVKRKEGKSIEMIQKIKRINIFKDKKN